MLEVLKLLQLRKCRENEQLSDPAAKLRKGSSEEPDPASASLLPARVLPSRSPILPSPLPPCLTFNLPDQTSWQNQKITQREWRRNLGWFLANTGDRVPAKKSYQFFSAGRFAPFGYRFSCIRFVAEPVEEAEVIQYWQQPFIVPSENYYTM